MQKNILQTLGVFMTWVILSMCPGMAAYAADDYLSALESEADDTGAVSKGNKSKHVAASKVINPGLSFAEFEEILDSQYSGSNFLYVKLSGKKRKSVYRFYKNDNRISSVREEIVRLLSSS